LSFSCVLLSKQTLKVRSAPGTAKSLRIEALSGAEDRRVKTSSDEERYYMREYAPGDRFRDINWKSSERIDTLITRISPDNQEKVTRIEVHFRNYGPIRPTIEELWLLDRAKARLAWFLRSVKDEKASFVFHVQAAGAIWELKDMEEIEAFLEELAALPFSPSQNEELPGSVQGRGEIYVFSTACDTSLPSFLLAHQTQALTLFIVQSISQEKKEECACLRLRDFPAGGSIPLARWFYPRKKRLLGVRTGRMTIDYGETRL
jgi:hypothetical protein